MYPTDSVWGAFVPCSAARINLPMAGLTHRALRRQERPEWMDRHRGERSFSGGKRRFDRVRLLNNFNLFWGVRGGRFEIFE